MKEKRKSRRVSFTKIIRYGERKPEHHGSTYDLSEEGIGIYTQEPLATNLKIIIEISEGNQLIRLKGVVRWGYKDMSSPMYKMGIKITNYPPALTKIYKKMLLLNPK